jgi:hypothetical protein
VPSHTRSEYNMSAIDGCSGKDIAPSHGACAGALGNGRCTSREQHLAAPKGDYI